MVTWCHSCGHFQILPWDLNIDVLFIVFWLVVYLPLWKIWKSMGRMTSHIWNGKIIQMFQTTNQRFVFTSFQFVPRFYQTWFQILRVAQKHPQSSSIPRISTSRDVESCTRLSHSSRRTGIPTEMRVRKRTSTMNYLQGGWCYKGLSGTTWHNFASSSISQKMMKLHDITLW